MSARCLARAYRLPHGFTAEFKAELDRIKPGEVNPSGNTCEWSPHVPYIRSASARRKFLQAYIAVRDDFLRDLARVIGGSILNIDLDEHYRPSGSTVFTSLVPS
jgi:hypothetical protein